MSYDLAVWEGPPPADDAEALQTYLDLMTRYHGDGLVEKLEARDRGEPNDLDPTPAIADFVDALLARWPDITTKQGDKSPWAEGPLRNNATGPFFTVGMVWSKAKDAVELATELAAERGLVCFDPQSETLRS